MSQPTLPFSSSTLTARGLYQQFSELETQVQSSKSVTNQQVQQLIALQSQTIQFLSQRPGKQTQESLSSSASSGTVGFECKGKGGFIDPDSRVSGEVV